MEPTSPQPVPPQAPQQPQPHYQPRQNWAAIWALPIGLVGAGALIGLGLFLGLASSGKINNNAPQVAGDDAFRPQQPSAEEMQAMLGKVRAVGNKDHIRGSANAQIKIVEYSDTECPFCKRFHETMKQVYSEYSKDGKVAWVYRHFPLDQLHPKARKEAEALECAAELGGQDKFWAYTDRIYEVTPANNGLDLAELPKIAQHVGLNVAKFNTCLSSGRHAKRVEEDYQNALATGGNGTPWTVIISANGKKTAVNGAQPYGALKATIDSLLK